MQYKRVFRRAQKGMGGKEGKRRTTGKQERT